MKRSTRSGGWFVGGCVGCVLLSLVTTGVLAQPRQDPTAPAATPRPPAAAGAAAALTGLQTFELRPTGISRIAFTSDAPLETIEGMSTQTTGTITVDLSNPSRQLTGTVQLPVSSLGTGMPMRDDHLRGANWLDAAHFANITLELVRTDLRALRPGRQGRGRVTGRLTVHGQTHDVTVPVIARTIALDATEHAGMDQVGINANMLRVQGSFNIDLSDYGVNIPGILRLKVSNTIGIRFDLTAFQTQAAAAAARPATSAAPPPPARPPAANSARSSTATPARPPTPVAATTR